MILKYSLITFKGCLMILKCFFNDLSSSLNNCWVAEKTTKGAAAAFALCSFFGSQKFFELLLKSLKKHFKFIKQPLKVIKQYFRIIKKVSQKYFKIIVY